jgi:ABC-type cobalt transport system substrate-binding protein
MTLVAHLTFHMSKLKSVHEDKKRKDKKQAYHPWFDLIEHKFIGEVECILVAIQIEQYGK